MTTPVTDADVYRILTDIAKTHPHMRASNVKHKIDKEIRLREMAGKKEAKHERDPLDMPVAKRIMKVFERWVR